MLNEFLEYDEYTTLTPASADPDKERLNPAFFKKKNCTGVMRALTIIARHFLYNQNDYYTCDDKKALRNKCKEYMADWCGITAESADTSHWLTNYARVYDAIPNSDKNKTFEENWEVFCKGPKESKKSIHNNGKLSTWYTDDIYLPLKSNEQISYIYAATFPSIIADAITLGPLDNYYLAVKKGFDEEVYHINLRDETKKLTCLNSDGKNALKYRDRLLKAICYYLLLQKDCSNPRTVYYSKIDLSNWMNYPSLFGGNQIPCFFTYDEDDKAKRHIIYSGKQKKLTIYKPYFEKFDFKLVKANDKNEVRKLLESKIYDVYKDMGVSPLEKL